MQNYFQRFYTVYIYATLVGLLLNLDCSAINAEEQTEKKPIKKARKKGSNCMSEIWKGTWQGTIGKIPVTMNFDSMNIEDNKVPVGKYYYRSGLIDLILKRDKTNPNQWQELDIQGNVTGILTLTCKDNTFSGEWKSPNGKQKLPINAHAIESYSKTRLDSVKPKEIKHGTIGGHRFAIIAAEGNNNVQGLRLHDKTPGIEKINNKLFENYLSQLDDAIGCISYGRQERGVNDQYEFNYDSELIAWNTHFAVIKHSQGMYCGGAHPDGNHRVETYRTDSGELEDVFEWLPNSYRDEIFQNSDLGKLLVKVYRSMRSRSDLGENDADDCLKDLKISGSSIWPTDKGIVFPTWAPYSCKPCMEDITVPYKDILPFLSSYGRQQIKFFGNHRK